jgi:SAM-dependent methyltransferase
LGNRLSTQFRRRRVERFVRELAVGPGTRILDVGCGSAGLRALAPELDVVGLDAREQPAYTGPFVRGDARAMPFGDGEFDLVYCNSLIEHLDPGDRARLAAEIRRVGAGWWVQTPNFWFPFEPHVQLPAFQFLPARGRRWARRLSPTGDTEEVALLRRGELSGLFPESRIVAERLGPLVKSWIAVGPRERT